jgi:type IV pilus assembly protein PilW
MTLMDSFRTHIARGQRGVGMVEVMVAMVLGAMVVLGVIQVFTANRQTFRMQDGMAITQEAGTFAIDFIGRDLVRSGFDSAAASDNDDYGFEWANTTDGGVGGNDRIAIVYNPSITDGRYCTGEETGAVTSISNRYWVSDEDELMCQGAAFNGATYDAVGTPQVLADNVESFQILFGVDNSHGGCPLGLGEPTLYVPATLALPAIARGKALCLDPGAGSSAQNSSTVVRTVRIALLLRTENQAGAVVAPDRTYTLLDAVVGEPDIEPDDGRLRRLFSKTVVMRIAEEVASL